MRPRLSLQIEQAAESPPTSPARERRFKIPLVTVGRRDTLGALEVGTSYNEDKVKTKTKNNSTPLPGAVQNTRKHIRSVSLTLPRESKWKLPQLFRSGSRSRSRSRSRPSQDSPTNTTVFEFTPRPQAPAPVIASPVQEEEDTGLDGIDDRPSTTSVRSVALTWFPEVVEVWASEERQRHELDMIWDARLTTPPRFLLR